MLPLILSLLGLGGIGAAGIAFPAFGTLLLGFGRSIFGFLAKIPWQVYVAAALAGLIAFLVISRSHAIARADKAEARIELVCKAVRDVAGRPHQDCGLNELQIRAFGGSIGTLEHAIADQNGRIHELGRRTAELQAEAVVAKREAAKRSGQARNVADRLDQSAKQAPAQPCPVSQALQEQWQ